MHTQESKALTRDYLHRHVSRSRNFSVENPAASGEGIVFAVYIVICIMW